MGKQTIFQMTTTDEVSFLAFLSDTSDFVQLNSFANSVEDLFSRSFGLDYRWHQHYYIWNKSFSLNPEFNLAATGKYYISNIEKAPLIEFNRSWNDSTIKYTDLKTTRFQKIKRGEYG